MGPNRRGHARSRFPALLALLAAAFAPLIASCASNPRLEVLAPAHAPPGGSMASDSPWTMHVIDNPNSRLPNGLDSADADGDGRLDLLTNYEWNGCLRIAFRPPRDVVAEVWPAVAIGRVPNAESSCFADLDGDGDPDLASNCEEFDSLLKVHLAMVWFENPQRWRLC